MSETKACPYCGEEILAVAVKCKHCGSTIEGVSASVKNQFKMRPGFVTVGAVLLVLFGAGALYNYAQTGTPSGHGFTDADVTMIERSIGEEYAKGKGVTVVEVKLLKESPRKLTGFAKLKMPLVGTIDKQCSATLGEDSKWMWRCQ